MVHEETVYDALTNAHDDAGHWAFGTGFDEPLAGVDTTVPDGVDPADLGAYCLMLGDDALVLAQRPTQWITNAPELEEEVAFGNIALDLLGQSRLLLARADVPLLGGDDGRRVGAQAVEPEADDARRDHVGPVDHQGVVASPAGPDALVERHHG